MSSDDSVVEGIMETTKILKNLQSNSDETFEILYFALNIVGKEGPITLKIGDGEIGPIIIGTEDKLIEISDVVTSLRELSSVVPNRDRYCLAGIGQVKQGPVMRYRDQDTSEWKMDFD